MFDLRGTADNRPVFCRGRYQTRRKARSDTPLTDYGTGAMARIPV